MVGRTIAHYRIVEELGRGGMGEVYRAHDDRLGRDVALKIIPKIFADDPERMARFQREAQLLASLNHPNIGSIYGVEKGDDLHCLVLEMVEGSTLADLIKTARLTLEEVLNIARQIADAVEAAHQKGIIHRDLKPANIKVSPQGVVKVLDFGLAKALEGQASGRDLSKSPAITSFHRPPGEIVLGTAAYVSPEQARGEPMDDSTELLGSDRSPAQLASPAVDKRTDIWAFGCVLFEMLSGQKAFGGNTVSDSIAKVLLQDPQWELLPPTTPPQIRLLLQRCLQKSRRRRLHDIADARIEIEDVLGKPLHPSATTIPLVKAHPLQQRRALSWYMLVPAAALGALIAGAVVWGVMNGRPPEARPPLRFTVPFPANGILAGFASPAVALSPNGTHLVYVVATGTATKLYVRPLDSLEANPLPDTDGAYGPFISPDGQWVGFFADGKLRKISLAGGPPVTLCEAPDGRGASWGADGNIIFAPTALSGLWRVSADGGAPEKLTTPDRAKGERTHRWPQMLPGGKAVLFTINRQEKISFDDADVAVLSLRTGKWRVLVEHGSNPHYVVSGHLVYARAGVLHVVPFDLDRLETVGSPVSVLEGVAMHRGTGGAHYSVSEDGSLAFIPGSSLDPGGTVVLVDRKGMERPLTEVRREYMTPRYSPDGQQLAFSIQLPTGFDVWTYQVEAGALTPLVFGESFDASPVWTPDGERVTFSTTRLGGQPNLFWTRADGTGGEERLTVSDNVQFPNSFSPGARLLAFTEEDPATKRDIWVVEIQGDRVPRSFLRSRFNEQSARFSPDGRWLAYASDESGQWEVYVQPFPGPGAKVKVSLDGGRDPIWSHDGRELIYRNLGKIIAVEVTANPTFSITRRQVLFERLYQERPGFTNFDISPDDQQFALITQRLPFGDLTQVNVVLNWFEELRQHVPTGND